MSVDDQIIVDVTVVEAAHLVVDVVLPPAAAPVVEVLVTDIIVVDIDAGAVGVASVEAVSYVVDVIHAPPLAPSVDVLVTNRLISIDVGSIGGIQGPPGPAGSQGVQGPQGIQGVQGPTGSPGATGPQGVQGPQGIQGSPGPEGPQGINGPAGPKGNPGPTGAEGPQGIQGSTGPQGADGLPGPQGPEGPQGAAGTGINMKGSVPTAADLPTAGMADGDAYIAEDTTHLWVWDAETSTWVDSGNIQGPQGPAGAQGSPGPQGDPGVEGPQGPAGAQGVKGDTGAQGIQGVQGDTGAQGPAGAGGATGATGSTGAQGPQGVKGDTGAQGSPGTTGSTGSQGPAGPPNALAIGTVTTGAPGSAAASTITGTPPAQTLNLTIPRGDVGAQGVKGDTGAQGVQGDQGPAGSPDTATQVLAKLVTVDGTGSGLDADLLDGQHASSFATSTALAGKVAKAGDTMTGPLTTTGLSVVSSGGSGAISIGNSGALSYAAADGLSFTSGDGNGFDFAGGPLFLWDGEPAYDGHVATKGYVDGAVALKENKANKGAASGYAPLDATTKIPASYLPAYVDEVVEFANLAAFPATGSTGIIYVALDTNKVYRWSGSAYTEISPSPGSTDAVPEGSVNLYYTNARAAAAAPVQSVAGRTGAVVLSKTDVGLGNVDNTSDANKPISTAEAAALASTPVIPAPNYNLAPVGADGTVNLNAITAPGWHSKMVGPSNLNIPVPGTYWHIQTLAYLAPSYTTQVAYPYGGNPEYGVMVRGQQNSVWGPWMGQMAAGAVEMFARSTPPAGWLKANGALINRVTYAALFAAIGTFYGAGDGSTTFALPDLRGEFLRAWDDAKGSDPSRAFGSAQVDSIENHTHPFTGSAMAIHDHGLTVGVNSVSHTHTFADSSSVSGTGSANHTHTMTGRQATTTAGTGFGLGSGVTFTDNPQSGASGAAHTHTVAVSGTTAGVSANHTHTIDITAVSAGTPAGTVGNNTGGAAETRPRNIALLACIKF